jgi:hypothetical protein
VKTILVIANETLGGAKLLETVEERAHEAGEARVVVCVPRNRPKHGNVIYDDFVFGAAQVRVDLARTFLSLRGIRAVGEVGDPDPYTAAMDAVAEFAPDEIIVSTYPASTSGWQRRDLVGRISDNAGVPVKHVVIDMEAEGLPFAVTLVVANRTTSSDELLDCMKAKAKGGREHLFVACIPQEGTAGTAPARARAHLAQLIDRARTERLLCAGMIGDPDPYTATMNALQLFRVDDIIISTLPATRSGWQRADLVERVTKASRKDVAHVEATVAGAPAGATV